MEKFKNIDWEEFWLRGVIALAIGVVTIMLGILIVYFGWHIKGIIKSNYIVKDGENTYYITEIVSNNEGEYTMIDTDGHTLVIYQPAITEKKKK
jgi:hypothetical protein